MEKVNELTLYALFNAIVQKSKVMNRFVVAPKYGTELNENNFGEITKDYLGGLEDKVKYPVALMVPPLEVGYPLDETKYSKLSIKIYFLTPSYNGNAGLKSYDEGLNTSLHTVPEDWKDMKVCALDFIRALDIVLKKSMNYIYLNEDSVTIERYGGGTVGNDNLAGVSISFDVRMFPECELIDYIEEDLQKIDFKEYLNTHQHHKH